jgi:hypothetical protein
MVIEVAKGVTQLFGVRVTSMLYRFIDWIPPVNGVTVILPHYENPHLRAPFKRNWQY